MTYNVLLLCHKPEESENANTLLDHITAFEKHSNHNVVTWSIFENTGFHLIDKLFDIIIIHYSISLVYNHLSEIEKAQIAQFKGLKVLFVQDEYRRINQLIDAMKTLEIDILFTCFPDDEIERIYPKDKLPKLSKYNNLTGYIPEALLSYKATNAIKDRPIDTGYRGRTIPYWLGELGYEKQRIAEDWKKHTKHSSLVSDIACGEEDRIYGQAWINFLSSCKSTLGVESGASVMDFTGKLEKLVTFHQTHYPEDSFEELQEKYFQAYEGQYRLNQISPRCFEAICLKTVLVLFEGEYSKILIPGRHYISLKKDFSNIKEVLVLLQDNESLQEIADRTYEEIGLNPEYTYKHFISFVDNILEKEFINRGILPKEANPLLIAREIKEGDVVVDGVRKDGSLRKLYLRLPNAFRFVIKTVLESKFVGLFFGNRFLA